MSKAKKGKEVVKGPGAGQRWDEQLIQEQLDTDSWRLCISVVAGDEAGSEEMVSALSRQMNAPSGDFKQRRRFYSLSLQEVLKKALESGTGAVSKSQASKGKGKGAASPGVALGSKPPGAEALADLVKSQSGSEEGVGADTLARAIKFSLLLLRQEDMVRRQQDAIKEGRPGSGAATPSKKKGGKQAKGAKGAGVEEGIPMPSKPESTMRKRGEEVGETSFVEDEPAQGPEAYLLLSGVRSGDVIAEMGRVGVAPSCLLRVRAGERGEHGDVEEEEREKKNKLDESLREFWSGAERVLETGRDCGVRDTGMLLVEYREDPQQERVQGLFDQVAGQIYQLVDQKRQHKQYIDSLSLADITQARARREAKGDQLYREQLGSVPNQCCSAALLMESLLQQVCMSDVTQVQSVGDTGQDISPVLQESLNIIKKKANFGNTKETEAVTEKTLSYPVIYEGDRICERDSLLEQPGTGLAKGGVEKRMLENFRVAQLLKRFPQLDQDERSRTDARYQQLQRLAAQHHTPLSPSQLQSLLIMLSFAEMIDSQSPQLFDDPYPDTERQESINRLTALITNLQWSEPLGRDVISQRVQEALSPERGYPTCLTKYHKQSDKLLILLHPLLRRSEWNARILTPTGFYLYQRFLHSRVSRLVERVYQLNSSDREKLLGAQDLTPTPSQVSLTQLSALSGEKEKSKEGRGSSHSKALARNSRTSRLKSSSRVSSPSVDRIREREASSSREDLLTAQRSEIEQKLLLLTGYDVGDEWYAGSGSSRKVELSESEFLSAEQRFFYSSPLKSVTMQYSNQSGLCAGISLLIDSVPTHLSTDTRETEDDVIKPATVPEPPAPVQYASYRVRLPGGIRLSLSPYGKLGGLQLPKQMVEGNEIRQLEEEHDRTPSPSIPPMTSESKVGGKGVRGKKTDDQMAVEQQRLLTEEKERKKREIERLREERVLKFKRENKYQTLFASTESGLQVTCFSKVDLLSDVTLRDGSDGSLRVTQCYPNSPSASQPCDKLRLYPASLEASRTCLEDGTVIKLMKDSSVQLLWPDGSIARSLSEGELELLNSHTPDLTALTNPQNRSLLSLISCKDTEFSFGDKQWLYTDRQGQRFLYRWAAESENEERAENESGKEGQELEASTDKLSLNKFTSFIYKEPLLKSWQTDPVSGEEMVTREDQVLAVFRKDGTRIVQFSDGTRVTSNNTQPFVQVECPGYAKVRFSTPSIGEATITLLDGNEIIADKRGTYSVSSNDVTCTFSQDGRLSLTQADVSQVSLSVSGRGDWISYKHLRSGRAHAINKRFETCESKQKDKTDDESVALVPRMFVLSRDGTGLELLSRDYAEREVERWKEREGVLLQSHALPGDSNVIIHSAVSPIATPPYEISHLPYAEDDIVPVNLRTQYYFPLDPNKYRNKSGVFGRSVGRGLQIGSVSRMTDYKRAVPRAFRRRELLEHRPIGQSAIDTFVSSLEGVNRWWDEIKRERELFSPLELRTDSVLEQAQDLFTLFTSSHSEDNDVVIQEYRDTILAPPPMERVHAPAERRPERVEADRAELETFQSNFVALRNRDIPGYFASESGLQFLLEERSAPPDMRRLTQELPVAMRRGAEGGEASAATPATKSERLINPRLSELSQDTGPLTAAYASTTIILPDNSGSSVSLTNRDRPGNPSPHVSPSADPSLATTEDSPVHSPEKHDQGEGADRPQKPTPLGAGSHMGTPIPEYLFYNVAGIPRTAPVRLPNSLKSLRPGDKECEQQDKTKRQTNTASLSMPLCKGLKQGISLLETEVDFGILKEGCAYSYTLQVKNTGTTSTRFKIKPPPPSTGIKASYTPHPIAAGMSASFRIEIYAVPVGVAGERGQGRVQHSLEIVSEVNSLQLPVTATVLTAATYEEASLTLAKGVSLLPAKASSATGSQRL